MNNAMSGLAAATLILFVIALVAVFKLAQIHGELSGMREAVEKCEAVIPRNQRCRIMYYAEVVK